MRKLLLLLLSSATMAQVTPNPKTDSLQTNQISEVVIIEHRSQQLLASTPATVSVLNEQYLQTTQPRSSPEALFGSMGIFVQKTTHGGGSPFVRGLTGNQTLLLIDGIRLNNSTFRYGPNQYLNTIDAFNINRIEVLLGGGSVQYGSDALSGTILFSTPNLEFEQGFHGQAVGKWASDEMETSGRLMASYSNKNLALSGGITYRNFGDVIGGKNTGQQSPSGYQEQDFDLKAQFKLNAHLLATAMHQSVSQHDVPLFYRYQLDNFKINNFEPQRRNLTYLRLENEATSAIFKTQTLTFSYQSTEEGRITQKNNTTTLRAENDKVKTFGVTFNNHSDLGKLVSINSGLELYNDLVLSERYDENTQTSDRKYSRGLYPDNSTCLNYSIYSLLQAQYHKLTIAAGLRYNGFALKVSDETLGKTTLTPSAFVGNLGLSYQFLKNSHLFVAFNTGFRAPNIDDLGTLGIVDFRYEVPNFKLTPEHSFNTEVGYKLQTQRVFIGVSAYRNQLKNLIARVKVENQQINGINVYQKENIEEAYIQGWDFEAKAKLTNFVQLFANVSNTFGQNITKNEPMRRIPPLNGRIGLNLEHKSWSVRPEFLFAKMQDRLAQGDKDDNRIAKGGTPAWQLFNVSGGYNSKSIDIRLIAQNLFDEDYRTHGSGINGYGRSLWLSVKYKW